jgi:hypothetical protein
MIIARADELALSPDHTDLIRVFDSCFASPSAAVRSAAQQIADDYGRRLALLIISLIRADHVAQLARPSWSKAHWELWQSITTIHVGGGLLAGAMGPLAAAAAAEQLFRCGCHEVDLQLSPYGAHLPLAGLARTAPADAGASLLLDFGQSYLKQAFVFTGPDFRTRLYLLPVRPLYHNLESTQTSARGLAIAVADRIIENVVHCYQLVADMVWPISPSISLSLACYLVNGQPPPSEMGLYGRLQLLNDDLPRYLGKRLSVALRRQSQTKLFHDGTAAALVLAGKPHAAVLMLGTAIGVGFPPQTDHGLGGAPHQFEANPALFSRDQGQSLT